MKRILAILFFSIFVFVSACGGLAHVAFNPTGKTKHELIQKFGYPLRVDKGAEGTEIWIYQATGDEKNWYYIIKDDKIIKKGYGAE